jgi:hypothetical protein
MLDEVEVGRGSEEVEASGESGGVVARKQTSNAI